MANYELSNIAYKGNTYTIKDNSALHQSAIGSWTPDFANLKPLATYEYDIAATSYFKICERPNVTAIANIADEVLAFRITTTGTNIFSIADVLVRAQPTANIRPLVVVNHQTQSTSAATTGIRYLRTVNPKAANTSYTYEIAIAAYNTTRRHIKVEVFKTTSDWTFSSAATAYSYNSSYQTANDLTLYANIGILYNYTFYGTANYASYAGYKSSWDALFNSQGNYLSAGAAIAANQFVFIGKDNKVYPTTSTAVEIDPAWPIVYCTTAVSSGSAVTWSYLRAWGYFTPASSILKDTLVADDTVYMRCAYVDGKLYSSNTMTQSLTAGNTYIKLGKMYSTTAVSVNTYNSEFFTLDTDGHLKALNGYLFNAANASVANAVKRQFNLVGANDYPVLFDSNASSDITTATTIPSLTPAFKYNPSTGNLSSTLFTGSGAGLTDIPADELTGVVPITNGGTGISDTVGNSWYDSPQLHPRFVIYYDSTNFAFTVLYRGPLDGVNSVGTFVSSEYYKAACRATAVIIADNTYPIGTATVMSTTFDGGSVFELAFLFPDAISFSSYYVNGLRGTLTYDAADGIYIATAALQINTPKWLLVTSDLEDILANKEDVANKVTSIDSSSDDTQYPTAKLLYDTKQTLSGLIQDVDDEAEKTASKVTTIDSSSTDTQYPSAKAVYTAIPSKVDMSKRIFTGTCSTAAGTAAKTVNVGDGFELVDGVKVRVYMNTANSNTAPTLNVNSTGAKTIVIAGPAATSNTALSNTTSGFFKRNGWFEFTYAASYGSGAGRWVMDDTYSAGTLLNTFMARPSSINSDIANGGVRYGVVASSATGNPFNASASILWLHHDSANYTRQIAMAATIPPQLAFRAQNNGTWQPWEYVLSSANELENHMATMAYTAEAIDLSTGAVTIPINGTQYKLLQLTVFNNDISKPLGYPSLFLFNGSGTTGYKEGTSTFCSTSSTSSAITVTFDSSWGIVGSTSVDITALYRRIS